MKTSKCSPSSHLSFANNTFDENILVLQFTTVPSTTPRTYAAGDTQKFAGNLVSRTHQVTSAMSSSTGLNEHTGVQVSGKESTPKRCSADKFSACASECSFEEVCHLTIATPPDFFVYKLVRFCPSSEGHINIIFKVLHTSLGTKIKPSPFKKYRVYIFAFVCELCTAQVNKRTRRFFMTNHSERTR